MRKLLTLSFVIILIDQATKLAVKGFDLLGIRHEGMHPYESIQALGDVLRWTYVENPGMAFGLDFGMPVFLSLFSVAASIFLVYLIRKTESQGMSGLRIALALILGGAVGNLIDRVFYGVFYNYAPLCYGKVVDFIDVDLPDVNILGNQMERFYVFNIADAAVSVGVVLLLIFYPSKPAAAPPPTREIPPSEKEAPPPESPVLETTGVANPPDDDSEERRPA